MQCKLYLFVFLFSILGSSLFGQTSQDQFEDFEVLSIEENDTMHHLVVLYDENGEITQNVNGDFTLDLSGEPIPSKFGNGKAHFHLNDIDAKLHLFSINYNNQTKHALYFATATPKGLTFSKIPFWLSILPPLIAIALALAFREVLISLFSGVWVGAFIACGLSIKSFFTGFLAAIDTYILNALTDGGHVSIIVFSIMIGGMVAVISKNGGMNGVVNALSRFANSAKRTQFITWLLGICIFFDDYANTLIIGNTMRPISDRFKISREKLAYIVDSTAAPIAAIAFVTTWIGAELDYIGKAIDGLGIDVSAYSIFLNSLKYAHYPILTILFVLFIILLNKDFGAMFKAEKRARTTGQVSKPMDKNEEKAENELAPKDGTKQYWFNGVIPVLILIITTIAGLFYTGIQGAGEFEPNTGLFQKLSLIIGSADSYAALLWASLLGVVSALVLSISTKTLSFRASFEALMLGFKTMLPAIVILVLAWALANVTDSLFTATFLTQLIGGAISPYWMPAIVFLLGALVAFSTGSSWGTMAILYPLVLPATWALCQMAGLDNESSMTIMFNVTSVVLAGAVMGDHCSPISDTTILSSLASDCNHIDHVKTQLPYALIVGGISILTGGVFFAIGIPWWIALLTGIGLVFATIYFLGKKVPNS